MTQAYEASLIGQIDAERHDQLLRILGSLAQSVAQVTVDELFFSKQGETTSTLRLRHSDREGLWQLRTQQRPVPHETRVLVRPLVVCQIESAKSGGAARAEAIELASNLGYSFASSTRRTGLLYRVGANDIFVGRVFAPHNASAPIDSGFLVEATQTISLRSQGSKGQLAANAFSFAADSLLALRDALHNVIDLERVE